MCVAAAENPAETADRKMTQGVVTRADFQNATIPEIVVWMRSESRRLDPDKVGVNFILHQSDRPNAPSRRSRITLALTRISMEDLLRYVCMASGMHYAIENNAVVIADPSIAITEMRTRYYNVTPDVTRSLVEQKRPRDSRRDRGRND